MLSKDSDTGLEQYESVLWNECNFESSSHSQYFFEESTFGNKYFFAFANKFVAFCLIPISYKCLINSICNYRN